MTFVRRLTLGFVIALSLATRPAPQRPPLELLDIAIEGVDGRPVQGLTQSDFELEIDGTLRPIESFAAGRERPLSLVLLFDITSSLDTVVKRSVVRSGVEKSLVDRLAPGDQVRVGSFGRQITIGQPIAGNPRALLAAVRAALDPRGEDTYGPSPIWDAIDAAVAALSQTSGRRAVLVVTDGRATGNREGPEDVGNRAVAAGVAVSVVGEDFEMTLRQDANTGVRVRPGAALEWVAGTSGGFYLGDKSSPSAPGPVLERLLADLHERYTIGFPPPVRDGRKHTLEVRVKRPGLTLRARRAFVAPVEDSR